MVQENEAPHRIYEYPFELVMKAYEKRFPTCSLIPQMTGSEVKSEEETPDKSVVTTCRRCEITVNIPTLIRMACGFKHVYFLQKNVLNRRKRTLDIEITNESFSDSVELYEFCQYSVHPENPQYTLFIQKAKMNVKSFFGFEGMIEKLISRYYEQSLEKGKGILTTHLKEVLSEGITYIPPFEPIPDTSESSEKSSPSEISDLETGALSQNMKALSLADPHGLDNPRSPINMTEDAMVAKIRSRLESRAPDANVSDRFIWRFLKAHDFKLDTAYEKLMNSLIWRRECNIDTNLRDFSFPEEYLKYYLGCWLQRDKDGCPVYLLKIGMMDIKGLLKNIGAEMILRQVLRIHYEAEQHIKLACEETGMNIATWTCILDLEGLNIRHIWRPAIKCALHIIKILEENFPESISKILITRAHRVFGIIWNLFCAFINERTSKKCRVFPATTRDNSELLKYIDKENLPEFLGGTFELDSRMTNDSEIVVIPKNLKPLIDGITDNDVTLFFPSQSDNYKTYSMTRQKNLEIEIVIYESGSLITWDFDVVEGNVIFSVMYVEKDQKSTSIASIPGGTILSKAPFSAKSSFKNDSDRRYEIEPVKYEESLSIQGSCYCLNPGTYMLIWDFADCELKSKSVIVLYHDVLFGDKVRDSLDELRSISSQNSDFSPETTSNASFHCQSDLVDCS